MTNENGKKGKGFSGLSGLASEVSGAKEPIKPEPKPDIKPSTPKQPTQPQRKTASSKPKRKAKGFSGLSGLASEVSGTEEPIKPEPKPDIKPSTPKQHTQPQRKTASSQPKRKAKSSTPPIGTGGTGKSNDRSVDVLIWGFFAVVIFLGLINMFGQENKKPSYNPPSTSQSDSYPQSSTAPDAQTPSSTKSTELEYTKPPVGTNNVLYVSEIRWCIRERIRIEAIRDVLDTDEGINEFNRIVNNYNSRCGSYRYRQGSRSRAERDVEPSRSQIVAESIAEARKTSPPQRSSSDYPASRVPKKPSAEYTREAQQILTDLGYRPGQVDGQYGRLTASAVKSFQRDVGIAQDGWIDQDLLNKLRRAKAAHKPPATSQPKPQSWTSIQPRSNTPYFTRGSHQDDVLRIQGTPIAINRYPDHEVWKYGLSSVDISARNRRVTEWNNISGNLKVRMIPGPNVTNTPYFTRGSHQDDVLRIQGTPTSINRYSDYEVWKYGLSSVDILARYKKVTKWNNRIGNLKARMIPGPNVTNTPYFTRGSHQDDVLRIQGTPTSIKRYSDYEVWKYGLSSVNISAGNRRVTDWNNVRGNLKVR